MAEGVDKVAANETLYRRVPASLNWYDPGVDPKLSPKAFRPRRDDTTGLSLLRGAGLTPEQVARNATGRKYYVAELLAGELFAHGLEVVPRPLPDAPNHAEIPALRYVNRTETEELQVLLALKLSRAVHGPFPA